MEVVSSLIRLSGVAAAARREARRRWHVASGLARALAFTLDGGALMRIVAPVERMAPADAEREALRRRVRALFDDDWRNVEEGVYPADLVPFRWADFVRALPEIAADAPRMRRRALRRRADDLPPGLERFPAYYRRNFHFQTGGWFEAGSARRYDAQVELLFGGTAQAMRRQVIPPVVHTLARAPSARPRVLDVACGTGSLLAMMARALPHARLYGVDLSPAYVEHARRALAGRAGLLAEDAESLPFADGAFDAVTCVYLLHELPPDVRVRVLREAARVLRPGGVLVLADSLQPGDEPALDGRLYLFPQQFHEPFFRHYLREDLSALLREAGLEPGPARIAFVTKIVAAHRA